MYILFVNYCGENLLFCGGKDEKVQYLDIEFLLDLGRYFLVGILEGLLDVMFMVVFMINSYKWLVENFWVFVMVLWGFEYRVVFIWFIVFFICKLVVMRFEIWVFGVDVNLYYVMVVMLVFGWCGIEKKLEILCFLFGKGEEVGGELDKGVRLVKNFKEVNDWFICIGSIVREVFGDEFVDYFGGIREYEIRLWDEVVIDW